MTPITLFTICFNAEKTIRKTIESVLANRTPDAPFTYIIQDGASKDGTLAIAKEYESQGVIVRSAKDSGAYDAIDKAIESVEDPATLIGFIHADDILAPGTIARVHNLLKQTPQADIVTLGCALMEESGHVRRAYTPEELKLTVTNCFDISPMPNARFVTKRLYDSVGPNRWQRPGHPYFVSADLDFFLRAIIARPVMVQDVSLGYIYIFHSGSTTLNGSLAATRRAAEEQRVLLEDYILTPKNYPFSTSEKLIIRRQAILNGLILAKLNRSVSPVLAGIKLSGIAYLPITLPLIGLFVMKKLTQRLRLKLGR